MKASKFVVATAAVLALSAMGAGAANATEGVGGDDPTFIIVLPAPSVDAAGCLIEPVSPFPNFMDYSVTYADNAAHVSAAVHPEDVTGVDITLTDRSGATDFIAFAPIPVAPGCVGFVEPVVTPEPVPVPVPVPDPAPTTECGDVVNGFPVGDNADMCDNPPVPEPDKSQPIPNIPPLVIDPNADVVEVTEPVAVPVAPIEPVVSPLSNVPPVVEVPTPVYAPDVATSDRVAAGEELAYTGANTGLAVGGAALIGLGLLSVLAARRKA